MFFRISLVIFLSLACSSLVSASIHDPSLKKHLIENPDDIFEFEINNEHIIKIQAVKNFISIYASEQSSRLVEKGLKCCAINKKYDCPKFIFRNDKKHLGIHRSLSELGITHFHLYYDCVRLIPPGHLEHVLNSLVNHKFIHADTRDECVSHYKDFLAQTFPDAEFGMQCHSSPPPEVRMTKKNNLIFSGILKNLFNK